LYQPRMTLWAASIRCGGLVMRLPRFRVRTLMVAVVVAALLIWGSMMGSRSYEHDRLARIYGTHERGWREIAARDRGWATFGSQCAEYYAQLARKYRRAMWRPWVPVAPRSSCTRVCQAMGFELLACTLAHAVLSDCY